MKLAAVHGELETPTGYNTMFAYGLGPQFSGTLLVPALTASGRVEHRSLWAPARCLRLPLSEVAGTRHP